MCELLGISITPPATMGVYFSAFRPRAESNQSGWGVGWYEGERARVVKETSRADESRTAQQLADHPPTSNLFLIHVRRATVGSISLENTHPFAASVDGRDWLFGHNGTIRRLERLSVEGFAPAGETDSEIAFHHLLTRLKRLGRNSGPEAEAAAILQGARRLSEEGKVNFLMSDGRTLYAYHDGHTSLFFLQKSPQMPARVRLTDPADYVVDLSVPEAAEEKAVIIATVPLTDEPWTRIRPGEFLICRDGEVAGRVAPGESPEATRFTKTGQGA